MYAQIASSGPRIEWVREVSNLFQALQRGLSSGAMPADDGVAQLGHTPEPINDAERLIFRCFVSELLLGALYFEEPIRRSAAVDAILSVWWVIRHDLRPVSVLRQALHRGSDASCTPDRELAGQIRDLIDRRYAERIITRRLADELGVSESRLSRCFRLAFGRTIHQHVLRTRIRHGLELVARGVKIEAAGLAIGFRSKKDFYRAVQQFVGCTPAQFRSRLLLRDPAIEAALLTDVPVPRVRPVSTR
jgi:AraC-like DNA-binding protein